jgi:HAE1 family hydrophobic/amphiphilic exporter-1
MAPSGGCWTAAVDLRYLTVGIVLLLFLLSIGVIAGGKLKFVGFPDIDGDVVEARVLLPQGTPLRRTEAVVDQVVAGLDEVNAAFRDRQPDAQDLVQAVTVVFAQNPDAFETGAHVARVVVDLLGAETRDAKLAEVLNVWRDAVGEPADVIAIKFAEPDIGPGGRPIDLRLVGPDLLQLKAAAGELIDYLNGFAGVQDLTDDLRPGKREYRIRLKPDAGVLGIDARTVAEQLGAAFQGVRVDEFPLGTETYEVNLRVAASDRSGPASLEGFTIRGRDGALIPLAAVAEVEPTRGWARIHRIDGQRAITVQGDVDRDVANAQELLAMARAEFVPDLLERYPGVRLDVEGESKESAETGGSIGRNVLLGMFGVYALLAVQFRGWLAPLTVMLVIPTALIGVVFGHVAIGQDLTMPSIVGMASLFGVVVNDSILLVLFIRQARDRGLATIDAAKQAGRARFRPILLTSVTTMAGLLPLLLEKSLQAQILVPLAASIAFGLATATIAALFLVPAIYMILDDFGALGALHGQEQDADPRGDDEVSARVAET